MAESASDPRARVLAAALELFGERGYGGTSLQAIGDRVGFTKAAVYYHYRAKAHILTTLAEPFLGRMAAVVGRAPSVWSPSECRDLLAAYLDVVVGARVLVRVLVNDPTASGHPAAAQLRAQRQRLRDLLVAPGSDQGRRRVQASCAVGALEGAVLDFNNSQPGRHRAIILDAAWAALASVSGTSAPTATAAAVFTASPGRGSSPPSR